ncbi:MAG TPA: rhomboid family intramembrane serine protease [Propionibacteriaceae bacterium]
MSQPPAAGPDFSAPGFAGCYRHPDRQTGISCQRCHKPICGECMNPASVGFQCPKCVASGRDSVRAPRTAYGATTASGDAGVATKVVMGVLVAVFVLDVLSRGLVLNLLLLRNSAIYSGELWRLVTYGFTSVGLLGLLMNLLVLWLAGRAMEAVLGSWRFVALYVAAALGGATLFFLLGPFGAATVGASAAVLGLLSANAIVKRKGGEDIRGDIGLLVLLVLYSVLFGFRTFGWVGSVGGIAVGALVGAILAYAPRHRRTATQVVGLLGVVLVCVLAVAAKILIG